MEGERVPFLGWDSSWAWTWPIAAGKTKSSVGTSLAWPRLLHSEPPAPPSGRGLPVGGTYVAPLPALACVAFHFPLRRSLSWPLSPPTTPSREGQALGLPGPVLPVGQGSASIWRFRSGSDQGFAFGRIKWRLSASPPDGWNVRIPRQAPRSGGDKEGWCCVSWEPRRQNLSLILVPRLHCGAPPGRGRPAGGGSSCCSRRIRVWDWAGGQAPPLPLPRRWPSVYNQCKN